MEQMYLDRQTTDGTQLTIAQLAEICPAAITEVADPKTGHICWKVNFDMLRLMLGDLAVENPHEVYDFTWVGKTEAARNAAKSITKTLRPCENESVDWENTQNLYIEGENLEVLKLLQNSYDRSVKMIYIDPPYNTGEDFIYKDDRRQTQSEYDKDSGAKDELGNRYRQNTDTCGRFHSNWCSMMYERLLACRSMLTDDGVIFISIDDHEAANLKKICDEVFGEANFVANIVWEQGRKSMAAQVAVNHEYCLIYCKNKTANIFHDSQIENKNWCTLKQGLDRIYAEVDRLVSLYGSQDVENIEKGLTAFYKSLPNDDPVKGQSHYKKFDPCLGIYYQGDISQGTGQGGRFTILHPVTGKPCKCPSGGWRFSESKLPELLANNRIAFGKDETTVPCLKRYLKETEFEVFASVFYKDGRGASQRLDSLFGKHVFDYPKDEEIIKNFISLVTSYDESTSLVLDFFSGSATTAHAVMQLNAEDGGHRKFIMVQLPENLDENLSKVSRAKAKETIRNSIEFLDEVGKPHYLTEIAKERIRRAGSKIKAKHPEVDTGFRVLKVDETNYKQVAFTPNEFTQGMIEGLIDNIKDDRNDLDLLFECMLRWGVKLSEPISKSIVDNCSILNVNDGDLVACLDRQGKITEQVIDAIAEMHPLRVVLLDVAFNEASQKMNIFEQFKQHLGWQDNDVAQKIRVI